MSSVDDAADGDPAFPPAVSGLPGAGGATLTVLVAAGTAALVLLSTGHWIVFATTLVAAGGFGVATRFADTRSTMALAGASVGATAGAIALVVAVGVGLFAEAGLLALLAATGLASVALDAAGGVGRARGRTLSVLIQQSGTAILVGLAVTAVAYLSFVQGLLGVLAGGTLAAATAGPFVALVSFQAMVLAAGLALPVTARTVADWRPAGVEPSAVVTAARDRGLTTDDVPRAYWALLALQILVLPIPAVRRTVRLTVGATLGPVLTSGVLHVPVAAGLGLLVTILAVEACRRGVVSWFGASPPETAATQAGGWLAGLLATAGGVGFAITGITPLSGYLTGPSTVVGFPAIALFIAGFALFLALVAVNLGPGLAAVGIVPDRAPGVAVGVGLLVLAALRSVVHGSPPLAVYGGLAGALLTWDLGSTATVLGRQFADASATGSVTFVRLVGSAAVLAVGVAVAVIAGTLLGPRLALPSRSALSGVATVALVLVLCGALALLCAAWLRGRGVDG